MMKKRMKERERDIRQISCTCTVVYEAMQAPSPADSWWSPSAWRPGVRSMDQRHTHIRNRALKGQAKDE